MVGRGGRDQKRVSQSFWKCTKKDLHGGRQAVRMAKKITELAELGKDLLDNEFVYLFSS